METKNKKRKTAIMLAVFGIAIVCICIIGAFAKKAYDRHQEELRLQAVETVSYTHLTLPTILAV